jgi:general secretion pathway protein C
MGGIMKQLFNASTINTLIWVLASLFIAKTVWFGVQMNVLPKKGVNSDTKANVDSLYYNVKLVKDNRGNVVQVVQQPVREQGSLSSVKLLALYHASDMTIITVANKGKTKVLARNESINGYILTGGGPNYAEFTKNKKTHKIYLSKEKDTSKTKTAVTKKSNKGDNTAKKISSKYKPKGIGEISNKGGIKVVPKKMLEHYMANAQDIYKNVGISENNTGSGFDGFNITFVRQGSHFEDIGLKRGDVIRGINGERLDSYESAIAAYSKVKSGKNLTLTIQRDNEEKEFEYEIN